MEIIGAQILWLNTSIQINKKVVYYPNMVIKGILYINDLMNDHGLMDFNNFNIKYPEVGINFIQYCRLINAIPRDWKLLLLN